MKIIQKVDLPDEGRQKTDGNDCPQHQSLEARFSLEEENKRMER